jgi:hypothetical protein
LVDQGENILLLGKSDTLQTPLTQVRIQIAELLAAMSYGHPQHMLINRPPEQGVGHMPQTVKGDVSLFQIRLCKDSGMYEFLREWLDTTAPFRLLQKTKFGMETKGFSSASSLSAVQRNAGQGT